MPDEAYPIIVNPNPVPQKGKKSFNIKIFLLFFLLFLFIGSFYVLKNKFLKKSDIAEDKTTKQESIQTHTTAWSAFFEFDTETGQASLNGYPKKSTGDLFVPVTTQKPQPKNTEWAFEVSLENSQGEVLYRGYRVVPILQAENDPKIWEFGLAVPYMENSILRILDLEGKQIFAQNI